MANKNNVNNNTMDEEQPPAPITMIPLDLRKDIQQISEKLVEGGILNDYEIHILRAFGATLPNCDFNGRQKRIMIGGIERPRISSQALKCIIRALLEDDGEYRTRMFVMMVENELDERLSDKDKAYQKYAKNIAIHSFVDKFIENNKNLGWITKQVVAVTAEDVNAYVDAIIHEADKHEPTTDKKKLEEYGKDAHKEILQTVHARPLGSSTALFGRMCTDDTMDNVYSAIRMAHAYGIDPWEGDYDDFIAQDEYLSKFHIVSDDDNNDKEVKAGGAGHVNSNDIGSNTYYEYGDISERILFENLCIGKDYKDPEVQKEIVEQVHKIREKFIELFIETVPSGHSHPMVSMPVPLAVYIGKKNRSMLHSFDEAWQTPIHGTDTESVADRGVKKLVKAIKNHNEGAFAKGDYINQYWMSDYNSKEIGLPDYVQQITIKDLDKEDF